MLAQHGLTFDLMFTWRQLPAALTLARTVPQVTFILDHCAKPPISTGWGSPESAGWRTAVAAAARLPNLVCKLSGLTTMAGDGWTTADLQPFVDCVLEQFGPNRVMFGSDWPVSLRGGTYGELVDATHTLLGRLSEPERNDVLAANARRIYRLPHAIACE
jgi:L-fuconolactonase